MTTGGRAGEIMDTTRGQVGLGGKTSSQATEKMVEVAGGIDMIEGETHRRGVLRHLLATVLHAHDLVQGPGLHQVQGVNLQLIKRSQTSLPQVFWPLPRRL